jgi:hypothetical protein
MVIEVNPTAGRESVRCMIFFRLEVGHLNKIFIYIFTKTQKLGGLSD